MKRVIVFCEGLSEESFVRDVLYDHLQKYNIYVSTIGLGGNRPYKRIKKEIINKCFEDRNAYITTMIDYYGLSKDFPGMSNCFEGSSYHHAKQVELDFKKDILEENFISYIQIHEYESLLFSDLEVMKNWCDDESVIKNLIKESANFESPEHINSDKKTAPSKRIKKLWLAYQKNPLGTLIAIDIGLDKIRSNCSHFDGWLKKLESLSDIGS